MKNQENLNTQDKQEHKKSRNPRVEYHEECTCCPVHYTWREKPIPKHEVTIEMIGNVNQLYRQLKAEIDSINKTLMEYKMFRSIEKLKNMGEL